MTKPDRAGHSQRVLVIACGAIAHEIVAIRKANRWEHVVVQCLPAEWHNRPERIAPGVEEKISAQLGNFERIFVAYADCGTGGMLDDVLNRYDVERLPGSHCYEFFTGTSAFNELVEEEIGTFYLTDFLARHFERVILRGLGLDRHPELMPMYFGNYKRLVYLAQRSDDSLAEAAERAASTLGLEYEYRFTGLEPFGSCLVDFNHTDARTGAEGRT